MKNFFNQQKIRLSENCGMFKNIFMDNFFSMVGLRSGSEETEILAQSENFRVERIVSNRVSSPDGFWYDQEEDEKVWLLQGEAQIEFEGEVAFLKKGDGLLIKRHVLHRVRRTSEDCVWLAIFGNF